jgi:5-methylcytosine-specific restriction protein B
MNKDTSPQTNEIVEELIVTKSIILEGPPGTGKTFQIKEIIDELRKRLEVASTSGLPSVRTRDPKLPFGSTGTSGGDTSDGQLRTEWVTFHESFNYEEFILGRRPEPFDGGVKLLAHAGVLLDLAIALDSNLGKFDAGVLVIDEINRANAGRVFGEFMTLLDRTYRATINGKSNARAISPRLAGLRFETSGMSEPIVTLSGSTLQLPPNWLFPENLFVIATMNSVDKGALPLDSALLRRFRRFYVAPNEKTLESHIVQNAHGADQQIVKLTCSLFTKINDFIFTNLGRDYMLGHALFWDVVADGECNVTTLCRVWDQVVFPQLFDRFVFNVGIISDLLRRNIESADDLLELQQLSEWDEADALIFFRAIVDDNLL